MISFIVLKWKIQKKTNEKKKGKKKQNAFTWLQACFLGDVRVIYCNSLGDSHFQTNVIDEVKNLYLIHLLVAHTTRESLLNYVHMIVR